MSPDFFHNPEASRFAAPCPLHVQYSTDCRQEGVRTKPRRLCGGSLFALRNSSLPLLSAMFSHQCTTIWMTTWPRRWMIWKRSCSRCAQNQRKGQKPRTRDSPLGNGSRAPSHASVRRLQPPQHLSALGFPSLLCEGNQEQAGVTL